ncbi:hypothetical protein A2690_02245 [Candidatus Roizmanbacteria bacterium RIFCSPHIGHO2_01_FULL_39_12b]|uniref:DUF2130 domain-containing protein n=1 Tax=Candidatus Roizmanbacteria bacterium RIFCSPHIGHO2_01_FULL_39_12b TaxID=1802030 RepID=A0A1F7GEF5_9BACT|nr:MAG: hypothetical protein A2690_02245 [Candidatus Roizmanbacteria bacterium RIFCSPHIGHO2_01_FULL_39_12b]OGK47038.1 MAG: hypothetical protein A3B46_01385 [Candidatus Roizmanbacteria bacterium RIFCSPLOWO2_01_FULL_39_19]
MINDTIICPHCNKSIPLSRALSHQMIETQKKEIEAALEKQRQEILTTQQQREKQLIESAQKKAQDSLQLTIRDKENESRELRNQNKTLQEQMLELNRTLRQIRSDSESMRLEFQKKFLESEEKIKHNATKKIQEEYDLKILEKDKKLADALKLVNEYKQKIEQGSQQLQGEVLELELEEKFKSTFVLDDIAPVAKGVRGGDIIQTVRNRTHTDCGKIIWEFKRTKAWSHEWIVKLRDDQRRVGADIAVLISNILPPTIAKFGTVDGIWVGDFESAVGLSTALRANLIDITSVKTSQVNREEKLEVLHEYISGVEFKHKVEAIVEAFSFMQDELEREKRWFATKWARQERSIRRVIDQTLSMHGALQGIMGKALPDIEDKKQINVDAVIDENIEEQKLF